MNPSPPYTVIPAPREGVNDDMVRVVAWLVEDGGRVEAGAAIATLETTKTTFEIAADAAGFLFPLALPGAEVPVGEPLALVAAQPQRPPFQSQAVGPAGEPGAGDPLVTKKARELLDRHGLSLADCGGLAVVRAEDVERLVRGRRGANPPAAARHFRGEALAPDADWDAVLADPQFRALKDLLTALRRRMKARHNRHVPTGDHLYDRWELARDYGFGEGTSVYDECLILGEVKVGRHCWVGPYTVLDGLHAALTIGDYVDIGASAQIYTHNTIERALTSHRAPLFAQATTIGSCCFLAPGAIIAPGAVLGDHCFVAAGSYVEGTFPACSYIAGDPARRVGVVEIRGARARVRRFPAQGVERFEGSRGEEPS